MMHNAIVINWLISVRKGRLILSSAVMCIFLAAVVSAFMQQIFLCPLVMSSLQLKSPNMNHKKFLTVQLFHRCLPF
jgi:hypothetical protein